jgi:hypothetical protein
VKKSSYRLSGGEAEREGDFGGGRRDQKVKLWFIPCGKIMGTELEEHIIWDAEMKNRWTWKHIILDAASKEPIIPYFIFIDVNLPYADENYHGSPWFKEIAETAEKLHKEWAPGSFPANAIFFCNDPTYQEPERVPEGNNFWCYEVPIDDPKYPLQDPQISIRVAQSIIKRANIPNEYPEN